MGSSNLQVQAKNLSKSSLFTNYSMYNPQLLVLYSQQIVQGSMTHMYLKTNIKDFTPHIHQILKTKVKSVVFTKIISSRATILVDRNGVQETLIFYIAREKKCNA